VSKLILPLQGLILPKRSGIVRCRMDPFIDGGLAGFWAGGGVPPIEIVGSITSRGSSSWGSASSFTKAHTVTSDTDLLLVFCYARAAATARSVSSVTWNGVALTEVYDHQDGGERSLVAAYYLNNPTPGGPHNIVMTLSGNCTAQNFVAINLKNTHPTDPIGGFDFGDQQFNTDEQTVDLTAELATSVAFHQACWVNNTAPSGSDMYEFDTAGFVELIDEGDTANDGCTCGLAWKQLTAAGALQSHVLYNHEQFHNSWGTIEIKAAT
jgi:hypothetical protein